VPGVSVSVRVVVWREPVSGKSTVAPAWSVGTTRRSWSSSPWLRTWTTIDPAVTVMRESSAE
jgi:hypothetical protein